MLAYAPQRRSVAAGQKASKTLMLVILGHVAVVAVALTTKMTIDRIDKQDPTVIESIPAPPPPPPPVDPARQQHHQATTSVVDHPDPALPLKPFDQPTLDEGPAVDPGPTVGTDPGPFVVPELPKADPVRVVARNTTPSSLLRPDYPTSKIRSGEEAVLRLRLTIDQRGRVTAVEPVGQVDSTFLEAARRHILRSWRYKPATVDGVPAASSMEINLSFKLEDA